MPWPLLATQAILTPRIPRSMPSGKREAVSISWRQVPASLLGETAESTFDEIFNMNAKGAFFAGRLAMPPLGSGAPH